MISWSGSWRSNEAAVLTTESGLSSAGLDVGTHSGFGIQRHQYGKDWTCSRVQTARQLPGWWFRTENLPAPFHSCTPGLSFTTSVWGKLLHFSAGRFHITKPAPYYTTGTNWMLFWAFQKRGQGLNSMETNLTVPWIPQNSPMDAMLQETHVASQKTQISDSKTSAVFNFHQHSNSPTLEEN